MQYDCSHIHWEQVAETLMTVEMASYDPAIHKRAFENSHVVIFVFDGDRMIGFGRALSDDAYQAVLYDIAVIPDYQGKGVGKFIFEHILAKLGQCNVILYASPGKEAFYSKLGMSRMKTGMALFTNAGAMKKKGFIE